MPQTNLYNDLTQRLNKVLEPRYEKLLYENGDLIPTNVDLVPGAREIAYERLSEYGDADFMTEATTNIPVVDITVDEDRYPIYMIGSGFPTSLQEERAHNSGLNKTVSLNRFERRMMASRTVIAQRTNRLTSLGPGANNGDPIGLFPAFWGNTYVPIDNSSFNPYDAGTGFNQLFEFMVNAIESITDNYVSRDPTTMLLSNDLKRKMITTYSAMGKTVFEAIGELYPELEIIKVREASSTLLDASRSIVRAGNGKDRIMLYPKEPSVLYRSIEQQVAQLAPPEYIRVDGLRRIYPLFSCFTPAIIDYPQDVRYIDVAKKP